jgi:hypothetical protein
MSFVSASNLITVGQVYDMRLKEPAYPLNPTVVTLRRPGYKPVTGKIIYAGPGLFDYSLQPEEPNVPDIRLDPRNPRQWIYIKKTGEQWSCYAMKE